MSTTKAKCLQCVHYFITYDTHYPYGCQALNFKSRTLPHKEVETISGIGCQMYQIRAVAQGKPAQGKG